MSDEVSNRVGDYEILEFIGAGGMGKVFKVRNVISDRVEAMKVLLPELTAQEELIKRFLHEIKLLATLEHPNIAALHTALTIQGQFVMVMEYVEGTTIAKAMEKGPIPVPQAINYIEQVLSALSYAHAKGIIHRDIKPANMMLTGDGTIKLMDFGIARSSKESTMTIAGTTLGSLYYMSPEQVKGEPIDGRSDLYALGISLYEMLTGHKPFETGTDYSIMSAHLNEAPKPPIEYRPDLPQALNEIILIAVQKDPKNRFQSPDAMRHALGALSGSGAYSTKSVSVPAAPMPSASAAGGGATAVFSGGPTQPLPSSPAMPAMAAAAPQAAPQAPQATYTPPPSTSASGGHRGLYMTLGALIVVAGLVAAGLYIPRMSRTHAGADAPPVAEQPQPQPQPQPETPSSTSPAETTNAETSSTPATEPPPSTAIDQAVGSKVESAGKSHAAGKVAAGSASDSGASRAVDQAAAAQRAADQEALRQLEHESGLLSTRMASADASLNTMKSSQASSGLGLRGDIASAQERLHSNMSKLDAAIQSGDLKSAKHYMELCDRDADTLDRFLGH